MLEISGFYDIENKSVYDLGTQFISAKKRVPVPEYEQTLPGTLKMPGTDEDEVRISDKNI